MNTQGLKKLQVACFLLPSTVVEVVPWMYVERADFLT